VAGSSAPHGVISGVNTGVMSGLVIPSCATVLPSARRRKREFESPGWLHLTLDNKNRVNSLKRLHATSR
jgi:hypothetical protein